MTLGLFYATPVFVVLFLLFTFIPREGYHRQAQAESLLSRFTDMLPSSDGVNASGGSGTKIDTSTDLTRLGNRRERRVPVLYLTAPRDGTYYLRGEVY
ncbi:MAG: hypothetical protein IKM59_05715, partial [Oscillospiraceae bacterium]|nr:hypothetical protein [Oscillospiraceae bacterium]